MITLRARLNIGLGVILVSGFGLQWALRSEALPVISESQMVSRLDADIEDIRESLSLDAEGEIRFDPDRQLPFYRRLHSGHYYVIESPHQRISSPSLGDTLLATVRLDERKPKRWHTNGPENQALLMLTRGLDLKGMPIQISVGEDQTILNRHITQIGSLMLMLNGAIIFLALVLQWIFVRNALSPFVFLRRELASIAASAEFMSEGSAVDLMRAKEIKKLVDLIHQRLDRSRNAIGNLAHALKNPLTILFRLAEDPSLSGNAPVREALLTNTNIMLKIVEGELRRARVAGIGPAAHCFNPKEEVEALVKVIRSMYHERSLSFDIHVPDISLHHDRHDFMELLGNLVDNAAKWTRHHIDITIKLTGTDLLIIVEDDGDGCDEAKMLELLQRGARLDESRGGHGLGLSIVKSLVEQHGGSIQFARSNHLGGLKVITRLKESEYPLKD
ncbi:MAG: hypothetical protein RLZZ627_1761 [Pseudomonadota bacterium]|jgi:signal transduction histidine kinase